MSEVVTGDAVVLDVQIAQLPVRAVSALIDIAMIFICYLLGLMLWAATLTQFDSTLSAAIVIIFTVLVIVGYPLTFETATRGRSVGKIVMGLRVVSDDGGPERFRHVDPFRERLAYGRHAGEFRHAGGGERRQHGGRLGHYGRCGRDVRHHGGRGLLFELQPDLERRRRGQRQLHCFNGRDQCRQPGRERQSDLAGWLGVESR